jgi:curved DNA-binding protein
VDFKDYYQILGVAPGADKNAIKKVYRKLARQLHPDVNPGNKAAEEKFKTVNEAYQVLSDPEERKKYDELRAQYLRWQEAGRPGRDFQWQDWAARPGEGVRVENATAEDLRDMFGSDSPYSDFFTSIFGQARAGGGQPRARRGRDLEHTVDLTLDEAFRGATRLLDLGGRRIEARIPPGVDTGSRVRLAGQGEPGHNGGPAGDLYLITHVLPHPAFERQGDDLFAEMPVDVFTAALGGEIRVPTLDGAVMLAIPPRTQTGRSFRLRGKGMSQLGNPDQRGDLLVWAKLMLPEPLTDRELAAFRELAVARQQAGQPG